MTNQIAILRKLRNVMSVLSLGLLFSCAVARESGEKDKKLEPLYGFGMNESELYAQVYSGGCTSSDSFHVEVNKKGDSEAEVSIIRIKPDYCKAMIWGGKKVGFSLQELKIKPGSRVTVRNPFVLQSSGKPLSIKK